MITGTDLAVMLNPFTIGGAVVIAAGILNVPWLRDRYIVRELNRDTRVSRNQATALFTPDGEDNPPLVYFLALLYSDRLESVLVMHGVGAAARLRDGSTILHGRTGKSLTHDLSEGL